MGTPGPKHEGGTASSGAVRWFRQAQPTSRSRPPFADKGVCVRTGRVAEDAIVDSPRGQGQRPNQREGALASWRERSDARTDTNSDGGRGCGRARSDPGTGRATEQRDDALTGALV